MDARGDASEPFRGREGDARLYEPLVTGDRPRTAFQEHLDSIDRQERFLAKLAGRSTTDESDAALARLLQDKSETARRAFEAAEADMQTKPAEVAERDGH